MKKYIRSYIENILNRMPLLMVISEGAVVVFLSCVSLEKKSGVVFLLLHLAAFFYMFVLYQTRLKKAMELFRKKLGSREEDYNDWEENIDSRLESISMLQKQKYQMEILHKQAEIDALQSQINPHFLYNTLESIRGLSLMKGVEEIADMTEALAVFFRYNIDRKDKFVTVLEEMESVDNYIEIQKIRFNDRLVLLKNYDEEIMKCYIPKLTIQPVIENAIYHGLEPRKGKGKVIINGTVTDNRLLINIIDNGQGMDEEERVRLNQKIEGGLSADSKKGSGIALVNTNQRIRLCFGKEYGIYVYSTYGMGTNVQIHLPRITDRKYLKEIEYEE